MRRQQNREQRIKLIDHKWNISENSWKQVVRVNDTRIIYGRLFRVRMLLDSKNWKKKKNVVFCVFSATAIIGFVFSENYFEQNTAHNQNYYWNWSLIAGFNEIHHLNVNRAKGINIKGDD